MAKKAKVIKEKSIEDRIWESANKLRGNLNNCNFAFKERTSSHRSCSQACVKVLPFFGLHR